MSAAALALFAATGLLSMPGCHALGGLFVLLGPRRIQKAEHKFSSERVAIFIDPAHPESDSPVFDRALYDQIVEIFREKKVKAEIVPYADIARLQQEHPDFKKWTVQRVGREAEAGEVLYIRVDRLQLRESRDHPMISPAVELHMKVIGVELPPQHARLWPDVPEGKLITCTRPPEEFAGPASIDTAATKLGKDTAQLVAGSFYDVDLEEKTPKER